MLKGSKLPLRKLKHYHTYVCLINKTCSTKCKEEVLTISQGTPPPFLSPRCCKPSPRQTINNKQPLITMMAAIMIRNNDNDVVDDDDDDDDDEDDEDDDNEGGTVFSSLIC